jgi:hypothetical protein
MKTTPGPDCTVCTHRNRTVIERSLLASVPIRGIAARHGVSDSAIDRHKHKCMTALVAAAKEADAQLAVEMGRETLDTVRALVADGLAYLDECKEEGGKVGVPMYGQLKGLLELQAKLLGEVPQFTNATQTNVQINMGREAEKLPTWLASIVPDHDHAAVGTVWVAAGKPDSVDEMLAEWDELHTVVRRYAGVRR